MFKTLKKLMILSIAVSCFLLGIFCADRSGFVSHWNDPLNAPVEFLEHTLQDSTDISQAKEYILGFLPKIEAVACAALEQLWGTKEETSASDHADNADDQETLRLHWYLLELWDRIENFLDNP